MTDQQLPEVLDVKVTCGPVDADALLVELRWRGVIAGHVPTGARVRQMNEAIWAVEDEDDDGQEFFLIAAPRSAR
jgi:hypothetical protein